MLWNQCGICMKFNKLIKLCDYFKYFCKRKTIFFLKKQLQPILILLKAVKIFGKFTESEYELRWTRCTKNAFLTILKRACRLQNLIFTRLRRQSFRLKFCFLRTLSLSHSLLQLKCGKYRMPLRTDTRYAATLIPVH